MFFFLRFFRSFLQHFMVWFLTIWLFFPTLFRTLFPKLFGAFSKAFDTWKWTSVLTFLIITLFCTIYIFGGLCFRRTASGGTVAHRPTGTGRHQSEAARSLWGNYREICSKTNWSHCVRRCYKISIIKKLACCSQLLLNQLCCTYFFLYLLLFLINA